MVAYLYCKTILHCDKRYAVLRIWSDGVLGSRTGECEGIDTNCL